MRIHRGLTAVMLALLASSVASAQLYTGQYDFLSFYHTTYSNSSAYYLTGTPGMAFLGTNFGDNTHDVFRQVTWDRTVTLNSVRVSTWDQLGAGGSIGAWKVQTSLDGTSGWTDIPVSPATQALMTGSTGAGFSFQDLPLTAPTDAKALRVLFTAGSYTVGTSSVFSGPGVAYIQARGTLAGGFNTGDPEFDILATTGIIPSTPTVTFTGNPAGGEFGGSVLVDHSIGFDSARAGFYPAPASTVAPGAEMTFDLKTLLPIHALRLYGGSFYDYLPTSASILVSKDGTNFFPVAGALTQTSPAIAEWTGGNYAWAQYVKFTNWNAPSYVLFTELFVGIPEPTTLAAFGVGVAVMGCRRKHKRSR